MTGEPFHLDILPPAQRRLWDELMDVPEEFMLYGGTAIALDLGHRASMDFNFFTFQTFEPRDLSSTVPFLKGATMTQQSCQYSDLPC